LLYVYRNNDCKVNPNDYHRHDMGTADLLDILASDPEGVINAVKLCYRVTPLLPVAVASFVYYVGKQKAPATARVFIEQVTSGVDLEAGNPVIQLRNLLTTLWRDQHARSSRGSSMYKLAVLIKTWNAYVTGDPIGHLRFIAGGPRPEVFPVLILPSDEKITEDTGVVFQSLLDEINSRAGLVPAGAA
jgi:hypothetical protein